MATYSNDQIKVRDYLKNKYGDYGITDADIGWDQKSGTVLLYGDPFIKPDQLINDRSWASQSAVDTAFTNFSQQRGMTPKTAGTQTPAYQSPTPFVPKYAQNIDDILKTIMSPEQFAYDPESDPAYQAIRAQNDKLGDTSMINTMAEASSMSGGRLNSWATTAGMQQKQSYDQNTLAAIPQLQDMAYGRYRDNLGDRYKLIDLLQGMDSEGYDQWNDDRLFNRDVFTSDRNFDRDVYEYDDTMGYQKGRDAVEDERYNTEWKYTQEQDAIDNAIASKAASTRSTSSGGGGGSPVAAPPKPMMDYDTAYVQARLTLGEGAQPEEIMDLAYQLMEGKTSNDFDEMYQSAVADMMSSDNPQKWFAENQSYIQKILGDSALNRLKAMLSQQSYNYSSNPAKEKMISDRLR